MGLRSTTLLLFFFLLFLVVPCFAQEPGPIDKGVDAVRAGRFEDAIAIFTGVLENKSASDQDRRDARVNRGTSHFLTERFAEAIADFTTTIEEHPDDPGLYLSRAAAFGRKGDRAAAFADFERALKLKPQYAEVYYNRGQLKARLNETADAIQDLSIALRLRPGFAPAAIALANLHAGRRETARAIEVLSSSLAVENDAYARIARGGVLLEAGRTSDAIEDFSQAIALAPGLTVAHSGRAGAYLAMQRFEEALRDYDTVLAADQGLVLERMNRANLYMILGEPEKAIGDYTTAAESDDAPPEVFFYRGCARLASGDLAGAKADLDRHVANHPDDKYGVLMRYVVSARLGVGTDALLRPFLDADSKEWPNEIIRFLGRKTTRADFLASIAAAGKDANQRTVEGHYYLGQDCLIRKDAACARHHFAQAQATGLRTYVEHQGASAELRQLAK